MNKKLMSCILTIVMLIAVLAVAPSASAVTNEVSLIYAEPIEYPGLPDDPPYSFNLGAAGYIEVENIAYSKNVTVHYSLNGGVWQDVSAEYYKPGWGNKEIWSFATDFANSDYRGTVTVEFAIKYEVGSNTYWDNNNGQNYKVYSGSWEERIPIMVFGSGALKVKDYAVSENTLTGKIDLSNIAYEKDVKVRYSTDNWATYKEVNASYAGSYSMNNLESWTFTTEQLPADWQTISFAASYTVSGITYWDNNFDANYNIIK